MGVVARFFIGECKVFQQADGQIGCQVIMKACQRVDEDNVSWTKWTPVGEMTKTVLNPEAAAFYRDNVGRDCIVTIELAGERTYGGEYVSEADQDRIDEHSRKVS